MSEAKTGRMSPRRANVQSGVKLKTVGKQLPNSNLIVQPHFWGRFILNELWCPHQRKYYYLDPVSYKQHARCEGCGTSNLPDHPKFGKINK